MESGANDYVRVLQRIEQGRDLLGVMLGICIHLNKGGVPLSPRIEERRTHRATHADVERERDSRSARRPGNYLSVIRGTVVHYEHIRLRYEILNTRYYRSNGARLIPRRNSDQDGSTGDRRHAGSLGGDDATIATSGGEPGDYSQ